jgi:hypothetical protein
MKKILILSAIMFLSVTGTAFAGYVSCAPVVYYPYALVSVPGPLVAPMRVEVIPQSVYVPRPRYAVPVGMLQPCPVYVMPCW